MLNKGSHQSHKRLKEVKKSQRKDIKNRKIKMDKKKLKVNPKKELKNKMVMVKIRKKDKTSPKCQKLV